MTLTSFDDLQFWFNNNQTDGQEGRQTPSHWTLYGGDWGTKEIRLVTNGSINNPAESLGYLVETIRRMNNPKGSKFRVQIYRPGAANNYSAQAYVQVFDAPQQPTAPAIAGMPGQSAADIDKLVEQRVELALLRQKVKDLEDGINGPSNGWERFMDTLSGNEELSRAFANVLSGFANKMGIPVTNLPMPEGYKQTDNQPPENGDAQAQFASNINRASELVGIDALTLSQKLVQLISKNPVYAKQLLAQ